MEYRIELTPDDNDTFLATCPDLPEVTTFGNSEADALSHAVDAVEEALAARMSAFEDIPKPTSGGGKFVRVGLPLILKVELYWALKESGLSRADLVRSLGWNRPSVDRLFDPTHASKLDQFDAAFRALGRNPTFEAALIAAD